MLTAELLKPFAQLIQFQLNIFPVRRRRILLILLSRRHVTIQTAALLLIFEDELVSTALHCQLLCTHTSEWAQSFCHCLSALLVLHVSANLNTA